MCRLPRSPCGDTTRPARTGRRVGEAACGGGLPVRPLAAPREPGGLDRGRRERCVVCSRQSAYADGADSAPAVEGGEAAEEEGEKGIEARPLDGAVPPLLGQLT